MSATSVAPARTDNHRNLFILLFAGFVLTGVPTVIIGPILPVFISRFSLNDAQAGLFFTVQFAASLCGVWITTALTEWRGYRPGLVIGYVLTGAGLALLNAPTHALALAATSAFGLGYGLVTPPSNLSAAETGGKNSAGLVSLLNFAWGIGAVACSPLILLALKHQALSALLLSVAGCATALAIAFAFVAFPVDHHPTLATDSKSANPVAAIPTLTVTIAVSLLFFIYVGTETSIGGWAAAHAKRLAPTVTNLSTIAPMFFYSGLTAGRAAAPLVLARIRELRVIAAAFALAAAGVIIIIAAPSQPVAVFGLTIGGLGCASVYPLYIAWFSRWYGAAARRLGGLVFSIASLGGSVLPWFVGVVSAKTGSLRIGLLVPLMGCVVMATIVALLHRSRSV
jgi:MFS transporter, FHS family, glucose/mannose:H+ symporter